MCDAHSSQLATPGRTTRQSGSLTLLALVPAAQHVRPGDELELPVPPQTLHLFDVETGLRVT
jgi:hypothetical protein